MRLLSLPLLFLLAGPADANQLKDLGQATGGPISSDGLYTTTATALGGVIFRLADAQATAVCPVAPVPRGRRRLSLKSLAVASGGKRIVMLSQEVSTSAPVSTAPTAGWAEVLLCEAPGEEPTKVLARFPVLCATDEHGRYDCVQERRYSSFSPSGRYLYLDLQDEWTTKGVAWTSFRPHVPNLRQWTLWADLEKMTVELTSATRRWDDGLETHVSDAPRRMPWNNEDFRPDDAGRLISLNLGSGVSLVEEVRTGKRVSILSGYKVEQFYGAALYGGAHAYSSDGKSRRIWDTASGRLLTERTEKVLEGARFLDRRPDLGFEFFRSSSGTLAVVDLTKPGAIEYRLPPGETLPDSPGWISAPEMSYISLSADGSIMTLWMNKQRRVFELEPPLTPAFAPGQGGRDDEDLVDIDAPPPSRAPRDPEAYAVVIGVSRYRLDGIPAVEHAKRDAQAVYDHLTASQGYDPRNVLLLTDAQAGRADLEKGLGSWLKNRVGPKSRVFVYFSGHGAPNPASGDGFLVPYDGDPNYLDDTAYPLARLYQTLGALPAAEATVVLDSCFSGRGGRSLLAKGARPLVSTREIGVPSNVAAITASASGQVSMSHPRARHGLLTYHLLAGLRGPADADGDGRITAAEAFAYARPAVERSARLQNAEQTPTILGPESPAAARVWSEFKKR